MPIRFETYRPEQVAAVADFNRRIANATPHRAPLTAKSRWIPPIEGSRLKEEYILAMDEDVVRGAYTVKSQLFQVGGQRKTLGTWYVPISEGIVDRKYGLIGLQIARDVLEKQPLLFNLGVGSEESISRMFRAMKWLHADVPMFMKVNRPFRFLRYNGKLRAKRGMALALDTLAFSGLGSIGLRALQAFRGRSAPSPRKIDWEVKSEFGDWTDRIWESARHDYEMIAVRDAETMSRLIPSHGPPAKLLLVRHKGEEVGWVAVLVKQLRGDLSYGDLRVGIVVDCLAKAVDADMVIAAATDYLHRAGVDVTVSNQMQRTWCEAHERAGFLRAPSTMALNPSPALADLLDPFEEKSANIFITRNDGEGEFYSDKPDAEQAEPVAAAREATQAVSRSETPGFRPSPARAPLSRGRKVLAYRR